VADSGAQFFTARSAAFEKWVQQWVRSGLAFRWSNGWSKGWREGSLDAGGMVLPPGSDHPRYAVHGGMAALARELAAQAQAQGATVHTRATVAALRAKGEGWLAVAEDGRSWRAARAVVTCPAPQALALLDTGKTALAEADRTALEMIEYAPCLCGLFLVEGKVNLPPPGAVQRVGAPAPWMADNRRKGISPGATVVTVQAGPELSRQHYNRADAQVLATLHNELAPFLGHGARVAEADLERWRYALPEVGHPERTLRVAGLPPLVFAGDAFGSPPVEGAALSGMAAGRAVFSVQ
jgi:predicted NAD/FAD-dependent oxidoreductase